ncbi:response regulator receiver sensor signal transduction histidine kinase (plasmid) [Thalassoporum mexicanum PCC 7367]|uniref:hybrid sensor histidine kinase/response regulator n=1 Tax=Thalassoporum mexicanum TaxID=3457544 RepID=UPI00029F9B2B|nr:hybrid sensor histidine kinase/response regulator [Pseudanabaena sp. PCC 7367]AFY71897.1 response regulator receiver sensor signal transduction histidine kinase [Pseudanabaena sp. PCC 7367]
MILVVDDEPAIFDVIEGMLAREGYELVYVNNGYEAISYLENPGKQPPDLILMDVMMPKMNGLETCKRVKANAAWRHIPIIMLTALNSKEDLAHCIEAGADDFIGKPISSIELRSRARSMLRIKQQYDALESTMRQKEDVTNMVVHDLRNPLSNIFLAIDILNRTDLSENQKNKIDRILSAAERLNSLVDDILFIAKQEANKLVLQKEEVNLSDMVMQALTDFEEIARSKNLTITTKFPEQKVNSLLDIKLIRRTIDNLLANAIKFSFNDSQILVQVEGQDTPELKTRVCVADNGMGVDLRSIEKIFEKYEVGEDDNKMSQFGLGLAFCKMVVEAHGGKIQVDRNKPQGAVFTLEI